ncbi:PQQ-binding-like beta-propeller repeat protein, partial [Chloroflexota bacterium]
YFGCFDRHVYAVNAVDGSLKWRSETGGGKWFWSKVVVYDGKVYAPNLDGIVYILDAQSGSEVAAAVNLGNPVSADPVVVGDQVVLATEDGRVFALDTASLERQLIIDVREENYGVSANGSREVKSPLAAGSGFVYIKAQSSSEDVLYAVEVETRQGWGQSLVISEGE